MKHFRHLPTGLQQFLYIHFRQFSYHTAVTSFTDYRSSRKVRTGITVYHILAVLWKYNTMIGRFRCQIDKTRTVHTNPAIMYLIGIFSFFQSGSRKPYFPVFFVYFLYFPYDPFSLRNLLLYLTVLSIYQIQMPPAISFGYPKYFFTVLQIIPEIPVIIDKSRGLFIY